MTCRSPALGLTRETRLAAPGAIAPLGRDAAGTDLMIQTKRTYEPPARGDGRRILVERLWPRGMRKEALAADAWSKEVAPTAELRQWFGHEAARWEEFRRRYRKELDANPSAWEPILEAARRGTVTLLYSAHDTVHNSAAVLREYLAERQAGGPSASGKRAGPSPGSGARAVGAPSSARRASGRARGSGR